MKKTFLPIAFTSAAFALLAPASHAVIAYALDGGGNSLIKFDLATPGITTLVGGFTGAATVLDGIDFRPADGLLYGYSQQGNAVVTIDLNSAATTLVSTPSTSSTTRNLGIDFNPVADRMRLVNTLDENLRINVATGATTVDGTLAYAAGDPNFGVDPFVNEAAYTNSDINPATGTTLFYIDPALDILVSTTNPNAGSLNTVGALGVNASAINGFDILSDGLGGNTAYLLSTSPSDNSLYTVNLNTGAATLVGAFGLSRVYSLAITQPSAVPDTGSSLALLGLALIGAGLLRRKLENAAK